MTENELPLLELFTRLRKAGLPLGIEEYRLALQALQVDQEVENRGDLFRMCRALWVKSKNDFPLFKSIFDEVINESLSENSAPSTLITIIPTTSSDETLQIESKPTKSDETLQTESKPTKPGTGASDTGINQSGTGFAVQGGGEVTQIVAPNIEEIPAAILLAYMRQISYKKADSNVGDSYLTDEYLPASSRQMKQIWRRLRHMVRQGPLVELDIDTTIDKIGAHGMFVDFFMVPRRINQSELILLIDHLGSMAPFHMLSRRLTETALRGGRLEKSRIFYFHNCPVKYLYHESTLHEASKIDDVFNTVDKKRTSIMIFSDAGAARGSFNAERSKLTMDFLKKIQQQTPHIVWLNPMPFSRWTDTTADEIAGLVPMFEASRRGIDEALDVLRGRRPDLRRRKQ
jgi:uncharacterized protein